MKRVNIVREKNFKYLMTQDYIMIQTVKYTKIGYQNRYS